MIAIKKVIDYWGLSSRVNLSIDPCTRDASWATENANPRIVCDCSNNVCHITHLSVLSFFFFFNIYVLKLNKKLMLQVVKKMKVYIKFNYFCRKLYALDISGELPQELFQLTELIDL